MRAYRIHNQKDALCAGTVVGFGLELQTVVDIEDDLLRPAAANGLPVVDSSLM